MNSLAWSIAALLPVFVAVPVDAADFTVSTSGGDFDTITECANSVSGGNRCVVDAGRWAGGRITSSGTSNTRRIVVIAAAGVQPILTSTINLTDESYLTIDGFLFENTSVSCANCSFITIANNEFDNGPSSIRLGGLFPGYDILVDGNTFSAGSAADIINQWGERWVIRNNIAMDIDDTNNEHLDFWQTWCESDGRIPGQYTLIENNVYADISGGNVHFYLFHSTNSCPSTIGRVIIRHNKVRNIGSVFADTNESSTDKHVDYAVYNNTLIDIYGGRRSNPYVSSFASNIIGERGAENNLYLDAVDTSGASGMNMDNQCHGSLIYDSVDSDITLSGCLAGSTGVVDDQDPLLTDADNDIYSISSEDSAAVDAGHHLTTVVAEDAGVGPSLSVTEAVYFQPGWAGVDGDCIAVGTVDNIACITAIDYDTNVLTLDPGISRDPGDEVWLHSDSDGTVVLVGSAPDVGAVEFGTPLDTTPPVLSVETPPPHCRR